MQQNDTVLTLELVACSGAFAAAAQAWQALTTGGCIGTSCMYLHNGQSQATNAVCFSCAVCQPHMQGRVAAANSQADMSSTMPHPRQRSAPRAALLASSLLQAFTSTELCKHVYLLCLCLLLVVRRLQAHDAHVFWLHGRCPHLCAQQGCGLQRYQRRAAVTCHNVPARRCHRQWCWVSLRLYALQ